MLNVLVIVSVVAILFALVALVVGCIALSIVVGVKNSTHQVVWKSLEPEKLDPFGEIDGDEDEEIDQNVNPNKRFKKFENAELEKTEEEFADLDDPGITSNFP